MLQHSTYTITGNRTSNICGRVEQTAQHAHMTRILEPHRDQCDQHCVYGQHHRRTDSQQRERTPQRQLLAKYRRQKDSRCACKRHGGNCRLIVQKSLVDKLAQVYACQIDNRQYQRKHDRQNAAEAVAI